MWEYMSETTDRMKVEGGWVVKFTALSTGHIGMTFVPDPKHKWEIDV